MLRSIALLALLLAWSSHSFAFPPCPKPPMTLQPGSGAPTAPAAAPPWFVATYAIVESNHPAKLPGSGICAIQVVASTNRASSYGLGDTPVYAPVTRFGVIALPELPVVAEPGLRVEYGLDVIVDSAPLPSSGDWFDLAQLEFLYSKNSGAPAGSSPATYYRVRKHQSPRGGTYIEVLEVRVNGENMLTDTSFNVASVAKIAQSADGGSNGTPLRLRWTQAVRPESMVGDRYIIDTTLQVIGPNEQLLYSTFIPNQWANGVSIGALDYNVANHLLYENSVGIELREVWLSADQRP